MSSSNLKNLEFKQFIWKRIHGVKNQALCSKLRGLSKNYNLQFEELLNCADVKYENLKNLATSNFAMQIHHLKLLVPGELYRIDDLWYISTKYFVNIQSIKLRFENSNPDQIQPNKKIDITGKPETENFIIRGLNIKSNKQVQSLNIEGYGHKLKISNSKFDGLELYVMNIDVKLECVKFLNSPGFGFFAFGSISIVMKDILVSRCLRGIGGNGCGKIFASNLKIQQCVESGCAFKYIDFFQIANANISGCRGGLHFDFSHGRMKDVVVKECRQHGVLLNNACVCYENFQFINNAGNDVEIDDYHNNAQFQDQNLVPSTFVQEVDLYLIEVPDFEV